MAITSHPANWSDVEQGLSFQPEFWGDALVGRAIAMETWKHLVRYPFFASAALVSNPAIQGHRIVALGTSVFVTAAFADSEISHPLPDINSRLMAAIGSGRPVLPTPSEVARANAEGGLDVLILSGAWRDGILSDEQKHEIQTLLISSFAEWHAGYRIRRILQESTDIARKEFLRSSAVIRTVADFPERGRTIHLITNESARSESSSIGNTIFNFRHPVLRLRDSDRRLLAAALRGATDLELAQELTVTLSAVKARWRSIFARVEDVVLGTEADIADHNGRGLQKRHRVLAYVRSHPEELRPFAWK